MEDRERFQTHRHFAEDDLLSHNLTSEEKCAVVRNENKIANVGLESYFDYYNVSKNLQETLDSLSNDVVNTSSYLRKEFDEMSTTCVKKDLDYSTVSSYIQKAKSSTETTYNMNAISSSTEAVGKTASYSSVQSSKDLFTDSNVRKSIRNSLDGTTKSLAEDQQSLFSTSLFQDKEIISTPIKSSDDFSSKSSANLEAIPDPTKIDIQDDVLSFPTISTFSASNVLSMETKLSSSSEIRKKTYESVTQKTHSLLTTSNNTTALNDHVEVRKREETKEFNDDYLDIGNRRVQGFGLKEEISSLSTYQSHITSTSTTNVLSEQSSIEKTRWEKGSRLQASYNRFTKDEREDKHVVERTDTVTRNEKTFGADSGKNFVWNEKNNKENDKLNTFKMDERNEARIHNEVDYLDNTTRVIEDDTLVERDRNIDKLHDKLHDRVMLDFENMGKRQNNYCEFLKETKEEKAKRTNDEVDSFCGCKVDNLCGCKVDSFCVCKVNSFCGLKPDSFCGYGSNVLGSETQLYKVSKTSFDEKKINLLDVTASGMSKIKTVEQYGQKNNDDAKENVFYNPVDDFATNHQKNINGDFDDVRKRENRLKHVIDRNYLDDKKKAQYGTTNLKQDIKEIKRDFCDRHNTISETQFSHLQSEECFSEVSTYSRNKQSISSYKSLQDMTYYDYQNNREDSFHSKLFSNERTDIINREYTDKTTQNDTIQDIIVDEDSSTKFCSDVNSVERTNEQLLISNADSGNINNGNASMVTPERLVRKAVINIKALNNDSESTKVKFSSKASGVNFVEREAADHSVQIREDQRKAIINIGVKTLRALPTTKLRISNRNTPTTDHLHTTDQMKAIIHLGKKRTRAKPTINIRLSNALDLKGRVINIRHIRKNRVKALPTILVNIREKNEIKHVGNHNLKNPPRVYIKMNARSDNKNTRKMQPRLTFAKTKPKVSLGLFGRRKLQRNDSFAIRKRFDSFDSSGSEYYEKIIKNYNQFAQKNNIEEKKEPTPGHFLHCRNRRWLYTVTPSNHVITQSSKYQRRRILLHYKRHQSALFSVAKEGIAKIIEQGNANYSTLDSPTPCSPKHNNTKDYTTSRSSYTQKETYLKDSCYLNEQSNNPSISIQGDWKDTSSNSPCFRTFPSLPNIFTKKQFSVQNYTQTRHDYKTTHSHSHYVKENKVKSQSFVDNSAFVMPNQSNTSNPVVGAATNNASVNSPATATKKHKYTVSTCTGNSWYAGTDANVFLTMIGSDGVSEEIHLVKSLDHKNPFERGHTDRFNVELPNKFGFIYKIKIRHDNTGRAPGWQLNKIVVTDEEKKKDFVFTCYSWLFKAHDHKLVHEIDVESLPIANINPLSDKNAENHQTSKFKTTSPALILRRGLTFKLSLKFARDYEADDAFYLTFKTGDRPRDIDKTLITVGEILPKDFEAFKKQEKWGYTVRNIRDPKNIIIEVFVPANALPAKYRLVIDTDQETVCEADFPVFILFNPWCKDDEVYLDDEEQLREYVLKQEGEVYVGSWKEPRPRKWHYGQFEEVSLLTAFKILEKKKAQDRDTAVEVARIVSSMVNSNDNNGLLVGNWSGEYDNGKSPTFWSSTPAILETYLVDNLPVKFGQCWVFSSIVTTIMRALGIPCRSVTNFSSAHDSDGNCSNDRYFDENGDPIVGMSHDSVWNFHVWNDVWMKRPDLPVGYDGWQAIDATPQEISQGLFQMGPASLRAVKEGAIHLPYDTAFVLAEVNADTIYWQKNKKGEFEVISRNRTSIGRLISTKAVGSNEREDITDKYKFEEGSILERASVRNALLKTGNKAVKETRKDIEALLSAEKAIYNAGEDVTLNIDLKNTANETLTVALAVAGHIVRYDGVSKAKLANFKDTIILKGNSKRDIPIRVRASTYLSHVKDDTLLRFVASMNVKETDQSLLKEDIIDIQKPDLEFKNLPKFFKAEKENSFTVSFTNPLDMVLTNCELYVDGTIITNRVYYPDLKNIEAKKTFEHKITLRPDVVTGSSSRKSIIVSFCSKELGGLQCNAKVQVEK